MKRVGPDRRAGRFWGGAPGGRAPPQRRAGCPEEGKEPSLARPGQDVTVGAMDSIAPPLPGQTAPAAGPGTPTAALDGGLSFQSIVGTITPENELLGVVAERIRRAAAHLHLSSEDLYRIFSRHSIFEGEGSLTWEGGEVRFFIVETHHLIQGKVGKGALKLVFPQDLLGKGAQFRAAEAGAVEVVPRDGAGGWAGPEEAEELVKQAMREFMTGESLSMSLKCQATGAPFAGSEGLVLCAARDFDAAAGRFFLRPLLGDSDETAASDRELIDLMMNRTAEILTLAGRIAYDRIVHAAETNSTLTARLGLQLPTNVVEGHLRALLQSRPEIIIGDEDMTPQLRELVQQGDYKPTACALARTAAQMQIEHSILLQASREKLRNLLAGLPPQGSPSPAQYREIIDLFFGTGEIQQNEDQLYHHRELILKPLSIALSFRCLDECGDSQVLALYLKTLLDNQRVTMEATLAKSLRPGQALPANWLEGAVFLSAAARQQLASLMPTPEATRQAVKESFWEIVRILCDARAQIWSQRDDPFAEAKREVLERAIRAITSTGDVIPSVDRLVFFTLPYTYECVTPKLGVVTRKPVAVCGSELRPEAMAVGGVMTVEILLKKLGRKNQPLAGMTVAIEGLGNAGKHVARLMADRGARIVAVSDSTGALFSPGGFPRPELDRIIAHKDRGRRLRSFGLEALPEAPGPAVSPAYEFDPDPDRLKSIEAEILVLTAIPGSIHEANASALKCRIICELTGAAVTGAARGILHDRQVRVIPDNLASSGGLLVSLSEMLQNSAGQNWDRKLEEFNLYEQLSAGTETAFRLAGKHGVDVPTATDMLALQRMHELALYRERVEILAARLKERIETIQAGEQVLIVSDDDEDGVASAAIVHALITALNPAARDSVVYLNESFRSDVIGDVIEQTDQTGRPIRHVFAVDRAFPLSEPGQTHIAGVAGRCRLTLINNHELPADLMGREAGEPQPGGRSRPRLPAELGILFISPQTLKSVLPAREFPTAMILRELAGQLLSDEGLMSRIDWQAAVGSYLDAPAEKNSEYLLFHTRFNPDKILEAAQAVRMVTRAGGFREALRAMAGVIRPDQLRTNETWERFMAEYQVLRERVQVLVEKIILENRLRPLTCHFFSRDEVASPTPLAGNTETRLDLYHWISEHLTRRGDLADKPIIVGQVIEDAKGRAWLGVRIRSPRGVDLMEAGLPEAFQTGGLPNTAVARIGLDPNNTPEQQFYALVDDIWLKTSSRLHLGPPTTRS